MGKSQELHVRERDIGLMTQVGERLRVKDFRIQYVSEEVVGFEVGVLVLDNELHTEVEDKDKGEQSWSAVNLA